MLLKRFFKLPGSSFCFIWNYIHFIDEQSFDRLKDLLIPVLIYGAVVCTMGFTYS